jgi:hypothetical protein
LKTLHLMAKMLLCTLQTIIQCSCHDKKYNSQLYCLGMRQGKTGLDYCYFHVDWRHIVLDLKGKEGVVCPGGVKVGIGKVVLQGRGGFGSQ